MIRTIRKNIGNMTAIVVLMVIAAAVGGYILSNQRLRFPVIQEAPFKLKAAFSTAQAVTPGQGQTVRVSGVRVGDISKVDLEDGRAIVTMDLDPEYDDLVHTDATAFLRPKTGLKDMFVELDPGSRKSPVAKESWTIPIQNTLPDINPDDVFSALDADTRDYLRLLVNGVGRGLDGRGGDLREVFRRFEPTHRDIARVTSAVAERRQSLRRLIHSLNSLNSELARKDDDIAQLVDSSAAVFRAFASEQRNVSATVAELPSALAQTTATLAKVQRFAQTLTPAAEHLRPAVRELSRANKAVRPFAREAAPAVQNEIRPFVRDARPLVRDLESPASGLADMTPDLTRSFVVLNHLFNTIGYNPKGQEDPSDKARQEGYLFWIAWISHQGTNLFSGQDANGPFRPLTLGAPCNIIKGTASENPEAEFLMNLTPFLSAGGACS